MSATILVAAAFAVLTGVGIIWVGARFLVAPQASAAGFGLPSWPTTDADGWLNLKGVRDVASGLVILVPLALGYTEVVGWLLLAAAVTPFGDAAIVLRHGGRKALAYGMHGVTGVVVLVAAVLFLLGS
jgi:hypothetical protein